MDSKYKPVIESHFVELNCTVEGGSKEQTIAWYHNDVVIDKEDIRYSTKEVEMDNVRLNLLQIKSVEVDRTGDYKCRVVEKVHYNDPPNSIESDPLELKIIRKFFFWSSDAFRHLNGELQVFSQILEHLCF